MAYIKYVGEEAVGRIADYVNKKLTFASSMPESPDANTIVLYVGADTSSYSQGGIYQYDGTDWNLINLVRTIELTQAEYDALPSAAKHNGAIYFVTDGSADGSIISGYYNETDGEFYAEITYETQYDHHSNTIYIDLPNNTTYIYDFENEEYVQVGGSGSGTVIKYVSTLPVTGIEDIIYGIKGYNSFEETIADGFLDENVLFEKEDDLSGGYIYTPAEDVVLDASDDGTTYKGFTSLAYDGTSDWTLTFDDTTDATLADGDTFYFRQPVDKFFAGDATNQKVIPFMTVDSELSDESENPVQNKVIKDALDDKSNFNNITENIETTTTASKAYSVDDIFILNEKIYKVISDIAAEGTIITTGAEANVNEITIEDLITTYTFETGDDNGTIKVTPSNGEPQNVAVKGLTSGAYHTFSERFALGKTHNRYIYLGKYEFGNGYTIDQGIYLDIDLKSNMSDICAGRIHLDFSDWYTNLNNYGIYVKGYSTVDLSNTTNENAPRIIISEVKRTTTSPPVWWYYIYLDCAAPWLQVGLSCTIKPATFEFIGTSSSSVIGTVKYNSSTDTTNKIVYISSTDKTKLNGIEDNAEVNIIESIKVGTEALTPDANRAVTLGTAAGKNVPSSGNASASEVVLGNDSRLSDARTPVSHTHTLNDITDAGTAAAKNSTNSVTQSSTDLVESGAVHSAIAAAISSVYKPSGDKTCAELVAALLIANNVGNVYNITDSGTTTSDFIGGAGKTINIGDNVAIVDVGTTSNHSYKFDLLSGFVDLSNYIQKSSTTGLVKNDGTIDTTQYISNISGKADKVSSATNGDFAGLDANGNLTDSGKNASNFISKVQTDSTSLSAKGWYNIAKIQNGGNQAGTNYGYNAIIQLTRTFSHTDNEVYTIILDAAYRNAKFNIFGSYNQRLFTKIRLVMDNTDTNKIGYIQVYYDSTVSNHCEARILSYSSASGSDDAATALNFTANTITDANLQVFGEQDLIPDETRRTFLTSSDDLNAITTEGKYYSINTDTPQHSPTDANLIIDIKRQGTANRVEQIVYGINAHKTYTRYGVYSSNVWGWGPWEELATTAVATTSANGLMSSTDKTKLDNIGQVQTSTSTTSNVYAKLSNVYPTTSYATNVFLITCRNGETCLLTCGTGDSSAKIAPVLKYLECGAKKTTAVWYDTSQNYVELTNNAYNIMQVRQIGGDKVDFTLNTISTKTLTNVAYAIDYLNYTSANDTSEKIYLVGATAQGEKKLTYSDDEIYATSGVLTTKKVQVGGTAATMEYNSTNKCIDFIFS